MSRISITIEVAFIVIGLIQTVVPMGMDRDSRCGTGEWSCHGLHQGLNCINLNKFCDGVSNCPDGSDETPGCTSNEYELATPPEFTNFPIGPQAPDHQAESLEVSTYFFEVIRGRKALLGDYNLSDIVQLYKKLKLTLSGEDCNKTYSGKSGIKYPLRVTGPFQRYLPFVCQISFVAMGGDFGSSVELSFLSFQIGRFELKRDIASACRKGFLKIYEPIPSSTEDPDGQTVFGNFCGRLTERSVTFYSKSSNVTLLIVVPSRASIPSTSPFSLFLTFRFLDKSPVKSSKFPGINQFGNPIPGTFCDRMFLNCHFRPCKIRSPNFPGFYPRNITCNYYIKQMLIPHTNMAYIVIHQNNDYKILIPKGGESSSSTSSSTIRSSSSLSTDCSGTLSDSLKIYDGSTTTMPLLAHLCGDGVMPKVVSSGPELLVQLYSAPYSILSSSRLEISISVKFEPEISSLMQRDRHRCAYIVDASRHRRWGVITSPKYTMPENSSCTYKFIGASSYDRIWLYFVSYLSREKVSQVSDERDLTCVLSKLEMFDSEDRWSVLDLHDGFESFPLQFCGETLIPKLCVHAADYPPNYSPNRPCKYPQESYLSSGPTFVLRHQFLSTLETADFFSHSSFVARYEFVDTRQDGIAIGRTECDRRFDSRSAKGGFISNPKNIFLYGRGGRENISCAFHFVGLPNERVRITIFSVKLSVSISDIRCESHFDAVTQRQICQTPTDTQVGRMAFLRGIEYWDSHSATIGCLCNVTSTDRSSKYIFDSLVSNVKFIFAVNLMSPFEDFTHFNFEAKFEFFNSTLCDTHVHDDRTAFSPEGTIEFHVPHGRTNFSSGEDLSKPLRCRWQIKAMTEKYLYVQINGLETPSKNCDDGIWALVYLETHQIKPAINVCVVSEPDTKTKDFHVFSLSWYNESYNIIDDVRDNIFIEIVSIHNNKGIKLQFHWMEVTKPFFRSLSGSPLRNVDCLFECPEIGACIDPHLWCDGAEHCPSGFDESSANCHSFIKRLEYLSLTVILAAVFLLVAGMFVAWAIVRHRHLHRSCNDEQDERSKEFRDRLTPTEDYQIESPIS